VLRQQLRSHWNQLLELLEIKVLLLFATGYPENNLAPRYPVPVSLLRILQLV